MQTQEEIMHEAGYVSAADAARAVGLSHVGGIHRMAKAGHLRASRVGVHWYISAASLLRFYGGNPVEAKVKEMLVELGVSAKPGTDVENPPRPVAPVRKTPAPRRARKSA